VATRRFDEQVLSYQESKSFQVRVDATNVLNHPQPGNPDLSINDSATSFFGRITSKSGNRNFQGQLRFNF